MKHYLGVDLGGTKVRVARVSETGEVEKVLVRDSRSRESAQIITENIVSMIKEFDLSDIEGIGIGVPGPVDGKRKVMTLASNIPSLLEYPLADKIEEAVGKKVYLNNDANVAGLAEAMLGRGKGYSVVYYITHSTGVGGALIIDGKLINGRNGYAGEVANVIIKDKGEKVNHLNPGAAENEFSGTALARKATEVYGKQTSTLELFNKAKEGDEKALKLIEEMSYDFARLLQSIVQIISPDCFIIGGGVSANYDYYMPKVLKYLNEMVVEGIKDVPVFKAEMKEPGVVGAAMLVRSENE